MKNVYKLFGQIGNVILWIFFLPMQVYLRIPYNEEDEPGIVIFFMTLQFIYFILLLLPLFIFTVFGSK